MMPARVHDITGQKFNKLKALEFIGTRVNISPAGNKDTRAVWLFECECGNRKEMISHKIIRGETRSCGCLTDEARRRNGKMPKRKTNGLG